MEPVDHLVEAVRTASAIRAASAIHQVRPVLPVRLIHSVHTIHAIHMIGTFHTVHTVHTAAPPDPLRPALPVPVGVAGFEPVGTILNPVGFVVVPVATAPGTVRNARDTAGAGLAPVRTVLRTLPTAPATGEA